jgi:NitT/TauT family transport system substrate-binding protein
MFTKFDGHAGTQDVPRHQTVTPEAEMGSSSFAVIKLVLALLLTVTALDGPAQAQPNSRAEAAAKGAKEKIVVRFTWKLKGEYAPLFVALDKGYYAAEGLDVDLAEGSGAETVVKMIGVGTDKIAYGPATVGAEAVDKGLPVKVVAIYQPEAPIALVSFPNVQLKTPKDLEGKTLGVSIGETFANLLEPFAKINHIDLKKVKVSQMNSSVRAAQFVARKLDVISNYWNVDVPLFEKKFGVKFNVLKVADFGLKVLGASFLVNDDFAHNNPDTMRRLLRATAKGYADAKRDYKGATDVMAKYMKLKIDRDVLEAQVKATMEAAPEPKGEPIGWQSEEAWRLNLELLKATNLIKRIKDLRLYYTNDYLR